MAFPTSINNMITDSVSQSAVSVFGQSGALAIGSIQQGSAQASSLASSGLINATNNLNTVRQATINAAVASLLSYDEVLL